MDNARQHPDDEVGQCYDEFWREIIEPNGVVDMEQVKRELYDYRTLLQNVPRVYAHVTGGRISKANTLAEVVIAASDDRESAGGADSEATIRALLDERDSALAAASAMRATAEHEIAEARVLLPRLGAALQPEDVLAREEGMMERVIKAGDEAEPLLPQLQAARAVIADLMLRLTATQCQVEAYKDLSEASRVNGLESRARAVLNHWREFGPHADFDGYIESMLGLVLK